ncbi:MAG: 1,4-dihydroxy-6-naphthoate synthase [Nitrospiraceae bacterium]|nr:1,4-dihydroxy-6-naphthoate synthase [Nitrospiraceae bacterium]
MKEVKTGAVGEKKQKLSLGYSPCPNDTAIFYALVHGKVHAGGPSFKLSFEEKLADVEALNRMGLNGLMDITKVSFYAYCHMRDQYALLRSGAALGKGCGPLLVGREPIDPKDLKGRRIAIPGGLTTANLLFMLYGKSLGWPSTEGNIIPMVFSDIMPAVKEGRADAGLVIHEGRFTFGHYGLHRLLDLGQWWEEVSGLPIPLGGIAAKRSLGADTIRAVQSAIRDSIRYTLDKKPHEARDYIRRHAQEMEDSVINSHIGLYVNDYTVWLNEDGERAIEELFARAERAGFARPSGQPLFIS